MNESITISEKVRQQFLVRASLVGLGVKLRKLRNGLVAILAGAQGLVEINKSATEA